MKLTALHLNILTHAKCYTTPWKDSSPAGIVYLKQLKTLELVKDCEDLEQGQIELTERGKVFIEAILNTPLPVLAWTVKR